MPHLHRSFSPVWTRALGRAPGSPRTSRSHGVYTSAAPGQELAREYTSSMWRKSEVLGARDAPEGDRPPLSSTLSNFRRDCDLDETVAGSGAGIFFHVEPKA